MVLDYSHLPVSPARVSDDNLTSSMRIFNGYLAEGVPEKNGKGHSRHWHVNRGEWNFNFGMDRVDCCNSSESTSKDIVDLLPSDPFEMDIQTTVTAIIGWLQDLELDHGGYARSTDGKISQEGYQLCAGWNFIWNSALMFRPFINNVHFNEKLNIGIQPFPSSVRIHEKPHMDSRSLPSKVQFVEKLNDEKENIEFQQACSIGDIMGFGNGSCSCSTELQSGVKMEGAVNFEGVSHEALALSLGKLGVKDLLSVERVCRSLCSAVRGDPLLWNSIHIDQPVNERITDNILFKLVSRAEGSLQCLTLLGCPKVTDDGLRRILETSPRLTKLFVPGCTRLSIDGVVNNIKMYNSRKDVLGIKHLRIGVIYGVTCENFEDLELLLCAEDHKLKSSRKPCFYCHGNFYLPFEDDRALDVEVCPKCAKVRLVYDCPAEGCRVKDKVAATDICRACTLCIPRCAQCGRCINDDEYEETFCLELVCLDCFKQLHKYHGRLNSKG